MNNKHLKEMYDIFIDDEKLQKEHEELFNVLALINENIGLVERSNEINEKLQEIMNK